MAVIILIVVAAIVIWAISAGNNKKSSDTAPSHSQRGNRNVKLLATAAGFSLDDEQLEALDRMENTDSNVFITGKAGTGKSYLLKTFMEITDKRVLVMAPTGIAALNVGGVTYHSALGYPNIVNTNIEDINETTVVLKREKKDLLKNADTIVIDEISMVRADYFDKIDRILRAVTGRYKSFGGKQMIVVGDLFQLPPIAKEPEVKRYLADKYGGIHFFRSDAYKIGKFIFTELTVNHRQSKDRVFYELLNHVREGLQTFEDIQELNKRYSNDSSINSKYTTISATKDRVKDVNQRELEKLNSREYLYRAVTTYDKYPSYKKNFDENFLVEENLRLRKGALIMMVANDPGHRWVNGTIGTVKKLDENGIQVSIAGHTYVVEPMLFSKQEATYVDGKIKYEDVWTISQYPIILAYAITIHKAQGQTYDNIICDVGSCFADGQAYVALSRCSSLKGLHLQNRISSTDIKTSLDVINFYKNHGVI